MFDEPITRRFLRRLATSPAFWATFIVYIAISGALVYLIGNPGLSYTYGSNFNNSGMSGPGFPFCSGCLVFQLAGLTIGIALRKVRSTVAAGLLAGLFAVVV